MPLLKQRSNVFFQRLSTCVVFAWCSALVQHMVGLLRLVFVIIVRFVEYEILGLSTIALNFWLAISASFCLCIAHISAKTIL